MLNLEQLEASRVSERVPNPWVPGTIANALTGIRKRISELLHVLGRQPKDRLRLSLCLELDELLEIMSTG